MTEVAAVDKSTSVAARVFAAAVSLTAIVGILLFGEAQATRLGSILGSTWVLLGYFTILTNVLVAIVFALVALGVAVRPRSIAGTTLAIVLVGVVYALLLDGLQELSGGSVIANELLHRVTPLLVPIFWLLFTPKGRLVYRDPLLWVAFPAAYLVYALVRGSIEGKYAYPFIDLGKLGATSVLTTCLLIGIGFVAAGALMVWLDGRLGSRR